MSSALFPHERVRDGQDTLMRAVREAIDRGGGLVAHAPTGMGKTAATLAPAVECAIATGKTVVFLTGRLTQHALALETVRRISARCAAPIAVVDIVGKKHLCLQEGVDALSGREFADHCRALREEGLCAYYERLRKGEDISVETRSAIVQIGGHPTPTEVRAACAQPEHLVCPYEVMMLLAKDARVIVADYAYLFNEAIREGFLRRIGKSLQDLIVIVDEGHNLPDRVKELATERLTTTAIARGVRELEEHDGDGIAHHVRAIGDLFVRLAQGVGEERLVTRDEILDGLRGVAEIESLVDGLRAIAETVRKERRSSSCGAIADFLSAWNGPDDGYVRILSVERNQDGKPHDNLSDGERHPLLRDASPGERHSRRQKVGLRYRCLDAGAIAGPVLRGAHASIVMSGTLTPPDMYARLLWIPDAKTLELSSPFPKRNRLNLIVPLTTTKFTTRSPRMYAEIARLVTRTVDAVPGNSAVFVPSYAILAELRPIVERNSAKTVFVEDAASTREDREGLLQRFRSYKASGAVLLGVMGGSFSEGVDLPGDELRAVVVVGLPLARPDLETKALIDHYGKAFGKGWEYAYTFPAFNKTLQTAGRCIRTEHDRGVIVFLDERYAWESYRACFPREWELRTTRDPEPLIRQFFSTPPEDEAWDDA